MNKLACVALLLALVGCRAPAPKTRRALIILPQPAGRLETYAAHEVRRYLYLRTGVAVPIGGERDLGSAGTDLIVVAGREALVRLETGLGPEEKRAVARLAPQSYLLKTIETGAGRRRVLVIAGGDEAGLLYGVYGFLEHLGVRFSLHGDTIPDERIALELPVLDEAKAPLFKLRGILPFHDFPEGPDWWTEDDYFAVLAQVAKLKMNFIGLHNYTYPNYAPRAEPTVWVGAPDDVAADGRVGFSYPASYQNNLLDSWGYKPVPAGRFHFGTADLFEHDDTYGDIMHGLSPEPRTPEGANELFSRTGALLKSAFSLARRLSIKTCVGTETPLIIPALVRDRLGAAGRRPDRSVYRDLYAGMFSRISRTYPIDYYWLWTPEPWTWQGVADAVVEDTINDMLVAHDALKPAGAGFELATCGWVLGPPKDRSLFDRYLPRDMAFSCINREVGFLPVDAGFARIAGRPKWAIPWLEDDGALTIPQLWVGRMRRDAVDARKYGCEGLLGIHWRTRVIDPNVSALAAAAWEQADWPLAEPAPAPAARETGPLDGKVASFDGLTVTGTDDAPLYRTVRHDVSGYRFEMPDGRYKVVLRFCEPQFQEKGKRVFGVRIQGRDVIPHLDIFARAGFSRALDFEFADIPVRDGRLAVDFVYELGQPCIAAIEILGAGSSRKLNCGGPAYKDYEPDLTVKSPDYRHLASLDYYERWCASEFGPAAGPELAAIFSRLDGKLPRTTEWPDGPGGIVPDPAPWETSKKRYAFIDELESVRPRVQGAGNLERLDYWLDSFRYMRAIGRLKCSWGEYESILEQAAAEKDPGLKNRILADRALPKRVEMIAGLAEVYRYLIPTIGSPGELGTLANWERHILPSVITKSGEELEKRLGRKLPEAAWPSTAYAGPTRIVLPTRRSFYADGKPLAIKVMILSEKPVRRATIRYRALGGKRFAQAHLRHVRRGVYEAVIDPGPFRGDDIEYYVEAVDEAGAAVRCPATAPRINLTLVPFD